MNVKIVKKNPGSVLNALEQTSSLPLYSSDDGFVKGFRFRTQKIGNILTKREVNALDSDNSAMIVAQTGAGKSWFAFRVAIPETIKGGKRVLILGSRTALMFQYKMQAASEYAPNLLEELTEKGIRKRACYGPIDVYTYQNFRLQLLANQIETRQYGLVIFDECHYFVQDAAFDRLTELTLSECVKQLHHCKRLYLTATPEMVMDVIINAERSRNSIITRIHHELVTPQRALFPTFTVYYFKPDYSYL